MSALTDAVAKLQAARQTFRTARASFVAAEVTARDAQLALQAAGDVYRTAKQGLLDLIDPPDVP